MNVDVGISPHECYFTDKADIDNHNANPETHPMKGEIEELDHGADTQLHRTLGTRHLTIRSAIGMGMWLRTSTSLVKGGPAALFIGFLLASSLVWAVNQAIGEMAVLYSLPSAFVQWTSIVISPAAGFALGWGYWIALNIQAVVTIPNYWTDTVPTAAWISIFWVVIILINIWAVRFFAEVEVVSSTIKFSWMIIVIISFIVITAGAAPQGDAIGFRYWKESPFTNGFKGFLSNTAFVAHEVVNPRRSMPRAISSIWVRLGIFYILGSLMITLVVSPRDPNLFGHEGSDGSPFVVAFKNAGLPSMAHITNAVIFISVISTASVTAYGGSRTLVGLAHIHMAPSIFSKADAVGRPWAAYIATMVLGGSLAYMNVSHTGADVFLWLSNLISLLELVGWGMICLSNLRLRSIWKYQGRAESNLPWRSRWTPYAQWWGLIWCIVLVILELYLSIKPLGERTSVKKFFANYVSIIAVIVIWILAQMWYRCPIWFDAGMVNLDEFRRFYADRDEEEGLDFH
ncbi:amino acid permease/ SLC12A domain-containing protein [Aspergillus floccosus]